MKLVTVEQWDEPIWRLIKPVYEEAFPHGAKPESVLRHILDKRIGYMHAGITEGKDDHPAAMAVTGVTTVDARKALVIDYLAVRRQLRGTGVGRQMVIGLRDWARREHAVQGIVIEVEAEDTKVNRARMRFWEACGFRATAYVHQYIWVPEPYRAMVQQVEEPPLLPEDGRELFRFIMAFHEKAYRRR